MTDPQPSIKSLILDLMGENPAEAFDPSGHQLDVTGWQSEHPWFEGIINQVKPRCTRRCAST